MRETTTTSASVSAPGTQVGDQLQDAVLVTTIRSDGSWRWPPLPRRRRRGRHAGPDPETSGQHGGHAHPQQPTARDRRQNRHLRGRWVRGQRRARRHRIGFPPVYALGRSAEPFPQTGHSSDTIPTAQRADSDMGPPPSGQSSAKTLEQRLTRSPSLIEEIIHEDAHRCWLRSCMAM